MTSILGLVSLLPSAILASVSQAYPSASVLPTGTLVSGKSDGISIAKESNRDQLLGIAVTHAEIELSNGKGEQAVITSGEAQAILNTSNGDILDGDVISISGIEGAGAKALIPGKVIGTARENFNAQTSGAQKISLKDSRGKDTAVYYGLAKIDVAVADYNLDSSSNLGALSSVQRIASQIAHKEVSVNISVAALFVILFAIMASAMIIAFDIHAGIISIGRNPLSKNSVFKAGLQGVLVSLVIMSVGITIAYASIRYL